MKHAYLILAHENFDQLKRLITLLDDPDNDIFVHIDASAKDFDSRSFDSLCKCSSLRFVAPRIDVHWGGFSIARAEMSLLECAVNSGEYFFFHLLSGSDLPIKSQSFIHEFFRNNADREFIDCREVTGHTIMRFRYYTLFPEHSAFFLANFLNNVFKYILKFLGLAMNRGVDFKCGSQWFSITGGFASYVVSRKEWIESVFSHTVICDESFIPTVFASSPYYRNGAGRNLRYTDWQRRENGHRHPHTFTIDDFDSLKSSPELFARKFDGRVDNEIIERISEVW